MPTSQASAAVPAAPPYESVVVGTDFTACSATAIGQAVRIAGFSGAPVRVVHVIDTVVELDPDLPLSAYQRAISENLVADAQRAWADFSARTPGAAGLRLEVLINNRVAGILDRAREHGADLLVLGAFGDGRPDVGFGTVATACVRQSASDVLLVRDTQAGRFERVVACVDFSATSSRALARAADLAARDGAELHVLHTFSVPWRGVHFPAAAPVVPPEVGQELRETLEARLGALVRSAGEAHRGLRIRSVCLECAGHRSGIVEYAKGVGADLIVLGTRGRTNLRDILLGSTAEKVLAGSPCSVLAVKPAGTGDPSGTGA